MKKKIAAILVCILVTICSTFTVVASTNVKKQKSVTQGSENLQAHNTLIADLDDNSVIEVTSSGTIVWQKTGLNWPVDAERLSNGNTLIAEVGNNRVIEVDPGGTIVWSYTGGLNGPFDTERLANGNTLITDTYNSRVIEVTSSGTIVWEMKGSGFPADAERLANGNTLIAEFYYSNRVIEVTSSGTIVWQKTGLTFPVDVERLANGNTLITEFLGYRVIEVENSGTIVWAYNTSSIKFDAERLRNGNTLITEFDYGDQVIEVNNNGNIVWQKTGLFGPTDAERINKPPGKSIIKGKTNGNTGTEYEYIINATDPDGDDVKYHIDWGDNTSEWTDFNASGKEVTVKHTWNEDGNYNISVKAQDIYGAEGPEGILIVTIPKNKPFNFNLNLLDWLFDRFPNLLPVLRHVLRL